MTKYSQYYIIYMDITILPHVTLGYILSIQSTNTKYWIQFY